VSEIITISYSYRSSKEGTFGECIRLFTQAEFDVLQSLGKAERIAYFTEHGQLPQFVPESGSVSWSEYYGTQTESHIAQIIIPAEYIAVSIDNGVIQRLPVPASLFNVSDRVYLNDPRSIDCGKIGTIEEINEPDDKTDTRYYLFRLDGGKFAYYYPDSLLSSKPVRGYSRKRDRAFRRKVGYPHINEVVPSRAGFVEQFGSFDETFGLKETDIAEQAERATPPNTGTDFDKGFGIGGLARHPADEGLTELVASGQLVPREPAGNKMPHGQLWEPCPICHQEPVCVDCGFCEKHCTC